MQQPIIARTRRTPTNANAMMTYLLISPLFVGVDMVSESVGSGTVILPGGVLFEVLDVIGLVAVDSVVAVDGMVAVDGDGVVVVVVVVVVGVVVVGGS